MLGFLEIARMVGGGWERGGRGILTRLEFAHAARVKLLHVGLVTPSQPMRMFVFFSEKRKGSTNVFLFCRKGTPGRTACTYMRRDNLYMGHDD